MIRIGILSTAHGHAHSYASALQTLADVQLVGVADEDSARGRAFAERFAIAIEHPGSPRCIRREARRHPRFAANEK